MTAAAPPAAPRGTNGKAPPASTYQLVPVAHVMVGPNVRADVGDLEELKASIEQVGILQPIRVEPGGDGLFLLKIGHRRLAAAKLAGLTHVPAIVDSTPALGASRTIEQLVENVQRRDLNALEEARALRAILDASKGMTQDQLADKVGRSRPAVTNLLRILDTAAPVQQAVAKGQIAAAHAKALAGLPKGEQKELLHLVTQYGYSAHRLEEHIEQRARQKKRDAEEVVKLTKWAEGAEALLVEKGADKKTSTLTSTDGYGYHDAPLKALKARGWKVGSPKSFSRGKCDCNAFGVSRSYDGGTQVVRRCIVEAHYVAKQKAAGKSDRGAKQEEDRRRSYAQAEALRGVIHDQVAEAFSKLPPDVGRLLLWSQLRYYVNEWVRDHKGDRKKPDAWAELVELPAAELVEELTTRLLKDVSPQFGIHLDWTAVAAAFGVSIEDPAKAATE
jgi:ParB/RepB/Spo0J family partition protein